LGSRKRCSQCDYLQDVGEYCYFPNICRGCTYDLGLIDEQEVSVHKTCCCGAPILGRGPTAMRCLACAETTRSLRQLHSGIRSRSKKYGTIPLTYDQMVKMLKAGCRWCGGTAFSIDRINNQSGYELRNCQPSCVRCNMLRGALTTSEFLVQVQAIAKHCNP